MPLLYPELEADGLTPHKVNYVFISNSTEANFYVDITETIDTKIEALRQHESQLIQFAEWKPEERMREWAAEVGKKVGLPFAEAFRVITLKAHDEEGADEEE